MVTTHCSAPVLVQH